MYSLTVHLSCFEDSFVHGTIAPNHATMTVYLVIFGPALIDAAVLKYCKAHTTLDVSLWFELSTEPCAIDLAIVIALLPIKLLWQISRFICHVVISW